MDRLYNQNEVIIANESNKCSRSKYCEILCIEASKCEVQARGYIIVPHKV